MSWQHPNSGRLPGYQFREFKRQSSTPKGKRRYQTIRSSITLSIFCLSVSTDVIRTTPWIACGPKCVVAGPPKTKVMLEFTSEYGYAPSVTQT